MKQLFFMGDGTALWVSDGIAADTDKLVGAPGIPYYDVSGYFVPFDDDGELLRLSAPSGTIQTDTGYGLWLSNGTTSGTFEIGGLGANGYQGIAPNSITAIGSKALFVGEDSTSSAGLWVTDGTTAGTVELGGLNNAGLGNVYFGGLNVFEITAFGNKAIFTGTDADDFEGLWVSDGTAAGTFAVHAMEDRRCVATSYCTIPPMVPTSPICGPPMPQWPERSKLEA